MLWAVHFDIEKCMPNYKECNVSLGYDILQLQ